MSKMMTVFLCVVVCVLVMPELLSAQPPGLPGAPDQAPVGGLALLAAAGGAYAWRKLRSDKR